MIDAILAKVFDTKNEREIKALLPTIAACSLKRDCRGGLSYLAPANGRRT